MNKLFSAVMQKIKIRKKMAEFSKHEREEYISGCKNIEARLEMEMLLLAHSLEKGILLYQHSGEKKHRGENKAVKLCCVIREYIIICKKSSYALSEAVSIISKYINVRQKTISKETINLAKNVIERTNYLKELKVGYENISKEDLSFRCDADFERFVKARHSIRKFSDKKLSRDIIEKAIKIANLSPSACNRQPVEVYFAINNEIIKVIDKIVPGNKGFENIPNYLVVTVRRSLFDVGEMYQWYINGGIYIGYLVLALHSLGVGSCIFQWPSISRERKHLKELLGIPSGDEIIAIIGAGEYLRENMCLYATRKSVDETLYFR